MNESLTLRAATEAEFPAFRDAFALVFGFEPRDEGSDVFRDWIEFDRSIVIEEGGRFVATGGAASYSMVVPGGATIGAGGLTLISVLPTHRRRGLLRRMLRHHLEDVIDRGEAVSILWASESSIYGRFGYGMAAALQGLSLDTVHGALRDDLPDPEGTIRILENDGEASALMRVLQQEATVGRAIPGALVMREVDWPNWFLDLEHRRNGATSLKFAVYEVDGAPRGYARYRRKQDWGDGGPEGVVKVEDLQALDGEAHTALWRFLLQLDLVTRMTAEAVSLGDPLPLVLADPRRLVSKRWDGLWVRIVDVIAALEARRYRVPGEVVLEVDDDFLEDVAGRFHLSVGDDGVGSCTRTDAAPDVSLGVEQLGAVLLGSQSLHSLADVGLVSGSAEDVERADLLFSWGVQAANTVHF